MWKAINRLRSEGFMIEAGTNKGYMLLEGRDVLTAEAVTAQQTIDVTAITPARKSDKSSFNDLIS